MAYLILVPDVHFSSDPLECSRLSIHFDMLIMSG